MLIFEASTTKQRDLYTAMTIAFLWRRWCGMSPRGLNSLVAIDDAASLDMSLLPHVVGDFNWWGHAIAEHPPARRDGGDWGHSVMTAMNQNGIVELVNVWRR